MAECYNIACPYCVDFKCKRTCTCDMRLDGEYVKVVRCKDCKTLEQFEHDGVLDYWCDTVDGVVTLDDYCSWGEPKENGNGKIY